MGFKLGGSFVDVREINTEAELARYLSDFGIYNIAMDVTEPENPQLIIHRTPYELNQALTRLLRTGSAFQTPPDTIRTPPKNVQRQIYLHALSPVETGKVLCDEEYATIQFDIMRFRAKMIGMYPASPPTSPRPSSRTVDSDQPSSDAKTAAPKKAPESAAKTSESAAKASAPEAKTPTPEAQPAAKALAPETKPEAKAGSGHTSDAGIKSPRKNKRGFRPRQKHFPRTLS